MVSDRVLDRQQFPVGLSRCKRRQFPQSGQQAGGGTLPQQHPAVPTDERDLVSDRLQRCPSARLVRGAGAELPYRAIAAARIARHADERAEFHQRLIELTRRTGRQQCGRDQPRFVTWKEPVEHAGDVAVHKRLRLIERNAGNRAGSVATDAR